MPFAPGQSGNPGGRAKADHRVRDLARAHTEAAINALAEALKNERTSVAAAVALLDRGWGKPVQEVTGADGGPLVTGIEIRLIKPDKPDTSAPLPDAEPEPGAWS